MPCDVIEAMRISFCSKRTSASPYIKHTGKFQANFEENSYFEPGVGSVDLKFGMYLGTNGIY